jgi:hypothetical protein
MIKDIQTPELAMAESVLTGGSKVYDRKDLPNIAVLEAKAMDGKAIKVMPSKFYQQFTRDQLAYFGNRHAFYGFPTTELVGWVKHRIAGRSAIEIGSGCGTLGKALGIHCTDNWMQADPDIKAWYAAGGQPTIQYPNHVKKLDYKKAILKYKPQVVVAQWVTNIPANLMGIDEDWLLDNVETYIHIGHDKVHDCKLILERKHETHYMPFLFSRSHREREVVWVWDRPN